MAYALGPVKPHVATVAESLGSKYGFAVVLGWRPVGSVSNSDHPKGLALDFMTRDKVKGDALSADLIANAGAYGVKYIIWWGRQWQNGAWKQYTGTSNPHIDHVHVSFNAAAGSGELVEVTNPLNPFGDAIDSVRSLVAVFRQINDAVTWLTDANNWRRIGMGIVALILFIIAVGQWDNVKTIAVRTAKKGVQSAK